jgi:Asp-tRNA(Asn)/Glu-tRNA(Gln) amidotransferase A subunit family amidase
MHISNTQVLHGLPVSLKDQLCMKGLETVMGNYIPQYDTIPTNT